MPLENFIVHATDSQGREKKMNVKHKRLRSILIGLHQCSNELFEQTKLITSSWRLVRFVETYCCDVPKSKHMPFFLHVTLVDCRFVQYLATSEQLCNMNVADI